ncbi:hypothetical protein GCM10027612_48830 [Microbispora bryophytorum subsp. camponoti]
MVLIDAIHVRIRDGQVANRPVYVALAVSVDGERDILGLWTGDGGEGAKFWLHVLTEIENRGVADVLMVVRDGLTGLPQRGRPAMGGSLPSRHQRPAGTHRRDPQWTSSGGFGHGWAGRDRWRLAPQGQARGEAVRRRHLGATARRTHSWSRVRRRSCRSEGS